MIVRKLSLDASHSLLQYLLDEEIVQESVMDKALAKIVPVELKRMTDLYHSLSCKLYHPPIELDTLAKSEDCCYYREELLDDCWSLNDHIYWVNNTLETLNELGIGTEKELHEAISKVREVQAKIAHLEQEHLGVYKLLLKLNGWEDPPK